MENEEKAKLLSTSDNPWNPFTQYKDWYNYDHLKGYCCEEYLARVADTDINMPASLYQKLVNDAVGKILALNVDYKDPRLPENVEYIAVEEP